MSDHEEAPLAVAGRSTLTEDPAAVEAFRSHPGDPLQRFAALLQVARTDGRVREPTAMTVATADAQGRPSARIMLLKGADADGLVFFTNLDSRKGQELGARPQVALLFHWPELEVQVRFEGAAAPVSDAEADAYFATRPRGSQLGAWASQQSAALRSREELEARLREVTARYQGGPVPRPPRWSGFRVAPLSIEFWKSRQSRLHDREIFRRESPSAPWKHELLNP